MFRASICPSSGVLGCIRIIPLRMVFSTRCCDLGSEEPVFLCLCFNYEPMSTFRIQNLHQCTRLYTSSSEPQLQHLVLNTIRGSIIRLQLNTSEDGHIDARNM